MRILVIFLTGITLSNLSMAQQKYQLDSVLSRSVQDNMQPRIAKQKYDAEKNLLEWELYLIQTTSEKAEGAKHISKFDERDNELYNIYSRWDLKTKAWVKTQKIEKSYDEKNRVISHEEYEMSAGQWQGLSRSTQEFDGNNVVNVQYTGKNENWRPTYKNTVQFNQGEQELLTLNDQWDTLANDWSNWMKHEYSYLRDSLLNEAITYHWKDGKWANHEKTVYKYTPDFANISERIIYAGTPNGWGPKYLTQVSYYQSKKWEKVFHWSEEDGKWKPEALSESYFDRYGRETDFLSLDWDKQAGRYKGRFQRLSLYDDHGRLTLSQEIYFEKGKPKSGLQMSFKFDEDGNLCSEAFRSLDVKTAKWIDQQSREFVFDKNIVLHEGGEAIDKARIGYDNIPKNKHAVKEIRSYTYSGGKKVLQEESTYFYSVK